jgi:hypothetical protein
LTNNHLSAIIKIQRREEKRKIKTKRRLDTMKEQRIEAIERELWLMEFKDHWDSKDWARRAELNAELARLKA